MDSLAQQPIQLDFASDHATISLIILSVDLLINQGLWTRLVVFISFKLLCFVRNHQQQCNSITIFFMVI